MSGGVDVVANAMMPMNRAAVRRSAEVIWLGEPRNVPELRDGDTLIVNPEYFAQMMEALAARARREII